MSLLEGHEVETPSRASFLCCSDQVGFWLIGYQYTAGDEGETANSH
jgi:hypothetical protein